MKKLIIFDLDNTFYEYEDAHQKGIKNVFSSQKIYKDFDDFNSKYNLVKNKIHKLVPDNPSRHSKLIYFKNIFFDELDLSEIINLENIYWSSFISNAKLQEKAINILRKKKKQEDIFVLLTNQNLNIQLRKINEWNLNLFDFVITSEEVGYEKPNPRFFNYVKNNIINFSTDDFKIYAIGDDLDNDISFWTENFNASGYLIDNSRLEYISDENIKVSSLNHAIEDIFHTN
tara:strand:- start:449 stop:1138 length:690 start_codon:yes stop_codon:yes gene_type:complete